MNVECSVCCDNFNSDAAEIHCTPCGHLFHGRCINDWFKTSSTCPQCRHYIGNRTQLRRLYFNINLNASRPDLNSTINMMEMVEKERTILTLRQLNQDLLTENERTEAQFKETQALNLNRIAWLEQQMVKLTAEKEKVHRDATSARMGWQMEKEKFLRDAALDKQNLQIEKDKLLRDAVIEKQNFQIQKQKVIKDAALEKHNFQIEKEKLLRDATSERQKFQIEKDKMNAKHDSEMNKLKKCHDLLIEKLKNEKEEQLKKMAMAKAILREQNETKQNNVPIATTAAARSTSASAKSAPLGRSGSDSVIFERPVLTRRAKDAAFSAIKTVRSVKSTAPKISPRIGTTAKALDTAAVGRKPLGSSTNTIAQKK